MMDYSPLMWSLDAALCGFTFDPWFLLGPVWIGNPKLWNLTPEGLVGPASTVSNQISKWFPLVAAERNPAPCSGSEPNMFWLESCEKVLWGPCLLFPIRNWGWFLGTKQALSYIGCLLFGMVVSFSNCASSWIQDPILSVVSLGVLYFFLSFSSIVGLDQ